LTRRTAIRDDPAGLCVPNLDQMVGTGHEVGERIRLGRATPIEEPAPAFFRAAAHMRRRPNPAALNQVQRLNRKPCGTYLFWTLRDANGRPSAVFRRRVGGVPTDDVLVYREADPGLFLSVGIASSRQWIVLSGGNQETGEAWLVPSANPTAEPRLVAARETGVRYSVDHWGDCFVIRTNADGAMDYKLVMAPTDNVSRTAWQDLVPHRPGRFITGFTLFAKHLTHVERVDALDRIVITERATGEARPLAADEEAYSLSVLGSYEYDTSVLRYTYESPREPRQVVDYDMLTGQRVLRKVQEIPSGHDPEAYVVRRLYAPTPDGAIVPITLLARRDAFAAGACPVMMYGYGAYGHSIMPQWEKTKFPVQFSISAPTVVLVSKSMTRTV
jgi:oligopeptidase B